MESSLLQLVLHGSWSANRFFLWAESSALADQPDRRPSEPPLHPYAASPSRLGEALGRLAPQVNWEVDAARAKRVLLVPSRDGMPLLPSWLTSSIGGDGDAEGSDPYLSPRTVPGLELDPLSALDLLIGLPIGRTGGRWWGTDLHFWSLVTKLGLEFLAHQKYIPGIVAEDGAYRAAWLPILHDPHDQERLHKLAQAMPPVCRALFVEGATPEAGQAPPPHRLLEDYLYRLSDRAVRDWGRPRLDRRRKAPEGIVGVWWAALWNDDSQITAQPSERGQLAHLYDAWKEWVAQLRGEAEQGFRLCFRLEPPQVDGESGEVLSSNWLLRYMLQASDDPSLLVPAGQVWAARGQTLHYLNRRFEGAQEHLLAGLGLAARLFPPIVGSLRTPRPELCPLTVDEAYAFLREVGPLLEGSGFGVLVPPWWNKPGARLGLRARIRAGQDTVSKGILSLDSLVEFDWELALGDKLLTREELERLAALKMPLVQVRGQWVMLQPEEVEAAIAFWEKRRQSQLDVKDALAAALGAIDQVDGLPLQSVQATGQLGELVQQLESREQLEELPPPEGFVGQLRPYQVRGYSWLSFMRQWGLGTCLADDMGLGKTIQAIALILGDRGAEVQPSEDGTCPSLVICPTSVVGNWKREINRFAPTLQVMIHHGSDRSRGKEFLATAQEQDVVISTYGLARRDIQDLGQVSWRTVFLDEAQNIKNPQAKQSQAIRRLPAANRVALTGTPVENRLSELWSIMQFLNPGFLGSQAQFRQRFSLPIERYQDGATTEQLRKLVSPFILRRLKTDPTIIQDLPEKLEMKVYCNLTSEQTTLYEAVVQESIKRLESTEDESMERRGIVLSMLMRLKQICNHPAQFLGDRSALPGRSGKLSRLSEMLEEALSVGDRALVFTQFAEMGQMLQAHLRSLFGLEVLFLHGGTPQKQRDRMVARFQQGDTGPAIFVLSLKAGGTGLNLTAANHVFHFDRWWNPAVENQATDRAFRIGQTRDVQVHKFICAGTLEERIDQLIESKKALAESVVGTGEGWLTELSTEELRQVITLQEE